MLQRWVIGVFCVYTVFPIMCMEKGLIDIRDENVSVRCQDGRIVNIQRWKVEESKFLSEKQLLNDNVTLKKPIYADRVKKKELELFSAALDNTEDKLLHYYTHLSAKDRHMLIDVAGEKKLDTKTLSLTLLHFYGNGAYMQDIIYLSYKNNMYNIDFSDWEEMLMLSEEDDTPLQPSSRVWRYSL